MTKGDERYFTVIMPIKRLDILTIVWCNYTDDLDYVKKITNMVYAKLTKDTQIVSVIAYTVRLKY